MGRRKSPKKIDTTPSTRSVAPAASSAAKIPTGIELTVAIDAVDTSTQETSAEAGEMSVTLRTYGYCALVVFQYPEFASNHCARTVRPRQGVAPAQEEDLATETLSGRLELQVRTKLPLSPHSPGERNWWPDPTTQDQVVVCESVWFAGAGGLSATKAVAAPKRENTVPTTTSPGLTH